MNRAEQIVSDYVYYTGKYWDICKHMPEIKADMIKRFGEDEGLHRFWQLDDYVWQ